MIGLENFLNKAVEYQKEVINMPNANTNPWQARPSTIIKLFPGRIIGIKAEEDQLIIRDFKSGNILLKCLGEVNFIPEIITKESHFVIDSDGTKYYLKDDFLHRQDGPAVETKDEKGDSFYLYGMIMTPEEYIDSLDEESQTNMLFHLDKLTK